MTTHWADVSAFLEMGGYGLYVWGSFGMAAAVMAIECLALRGRRQALLQSAGTSVGDYTAVAREA